MSAQQWQGIYDVARRTRASASGLRRLLLWCISVSLLPVLVTWRLPVAGTTYKPAVIKVFDLLSFPAESHISRPANTMLLPSWSMAEWEARATNWQCRDWTRGARGWRRRATGWRGEAEEVKRKNEWDRWWSEGWWNELRNVQALCSAGKNIAFSLLGTAVLT